MADAAPFLKVPADVDFSGAWLPPPITTQIPTDQDIADAVEFSRNIQMAKHRNINPTSNQAIAAAAKYEYKVLTAAVAADSLGRPSPWLHPITHQMGALAAAAELRDEIRNLRADNGDLRTENASLRNEVNNLKHEIGSLRTETRDAQQFFMQFYITSIKRNNFSHQISHLEQVPFPDGTFPWGITVQGPGGVELLLPPLSSYQAVQDLSMPEALGYCRGYYPEEELPSDINTGQEKILHAVGCLDVV